MNKIITSRQIICAVIVMSLTMIHIHIPKSSAKIVGSAGYISIIIGALIALLTTYCVYLIMKKFPGYNVYDILKILLGTFLAKLIMVLTILWAGLNVITTLHYHSLIEQSTLMPFSPDSFIYFIMLALSAYCLYKGSKVAMRISELTLTLFLLLFTGLMLIGLSNFNVINLLPVTFYDTANIIKASPTSFSIFGLIIFALFYADKLNKPQKSFKPYAFYMLTVFLFAFFITIVTFGVQGAPLAATYNLPFNALVQRSSLFNLFERLEAFILFPTFISDFVQIVFFMSAIFLSIKWIFGLNKIKYSAIPIFISIYILALLLEKTPLTIVDIYNYYVVWINAGFEFILPIIIIIMAFIRRNYVEAVLQED